MIVRFRQPRSPAAMNVAYSCTNALSLRSCIDPVVLGSIPFQAQSFVITKTVARVVFHMNHSTEGKVSNNRRFAEEVLGLANSAVST